MVDASVLLERICT